MPLFGNRNRSQDSAVAECAAHSGPCRTLAGVPLGTLRPRLRPLISPAGPAQGTDAVTRPFGGGLVTVLCVEGEPTRQPGTDALVVPRHLADQWGATDDQLWEWAFQGLTGLPLNRREFNGQNGDKLYVANATGSWPGAAYALRAEAAFGVDLPYGAVVSVPNNNGLCGLPIRNRASLQGVQFLTDLTRELRGPQPGPFGAELYWYLDGELERVLSLDGGDPRMLVSARIKAVLDTLPAG